MKKKIVDILNLNISKIKYFQKVQSKLEEFFLTFIKNNSIANLASVSFTKKFQETYFKPFHDYKK